MTYLGNKAGRYLLAIVLTIVVTILASTVIYKYPIQPSETYSINTENLIDDGNFENFNQTAWDCCPNALGNASILALKSSNAFLDNYSLALTTSNHCACISKEVTSFIANQLYFISLIYKGDNPRVCGWIGGDNKCLPDQKFKETSNWISYTYILGLTNKSESFRIHFYADSDGTKTVTNLYDDLQVHKLIPIENTPEFEYNPEEKYIFKTKSDNNVHKAELISDINKKTGEAYFLTKGKPYVTIKFPWSEVVIIIIMVLVVIRLMFKKNDEKII